MLELMIVAPAYAQAAGAAPQGSALSGFVPLILVFVLFYFLLIRPQQKKFKAHQDMIAAIAKGDQVVTGGGVHGKVVKVADDTVVLEISKDVEITVDKPTLSRVKTKPGADSKKPANDDNKAA
ncbi:MAG: preprotein translocase subunit YajC [Rickettsiales bacterium]|nr:preprotein translocase subunit YajC [Rickettsiales bacterium]